MMLRSSCIIHDYVDSSDEQTELSHNSAVSPLIDKVFPCLLANFNIFSLASGRWTYWNILAATAPDVFSGLGGKPS